MNNEEKILAILEKHGEMLEKLNEKADKQGALLAQHGEQLNRMESRLDEVDARSLRSAVLLETEVARDVRLVYEGQEALRQKMEELAPKERVEVLEDRVIALETVIKSMSKRLAVLEKAQ